jgi:hypothetical protein
MEIKVSKYQLYPEINPTGLLIGFSVFVENKEPFYLDTIVDISLNEQEAINNAWRILKEPINNIVDNLTKEKEKENLILESNAFGKSFLPPTSEEEFGELLDNPEKIIEEVNINLTATIENVLQPNTALSQLPSEAFQIDYSSMTVAELNLLALDRGLTDYSLMTKEELIELHEAFDLKNKI